MSKIVLANGCFDLLHYGHILYLHESAKMGRLYVGVTRDQHVNKGPGRPTCPQEHRLAVVSALRCVEHAFLCDDSLDALEVIKPDIFVKGADYVGKIEKRHREYCEANNISIRFTTTPIFSATKIINDRFRSSQGT